MSKAWGRGFADSLAVLFLASAVLAQEPEKKTPVPTTPRADCESNTCISKVLYLPDFSTPFELQEVVNTFRTVVDFTSIEPKPVIQMAWRSRANSGPCLCRCSTHNRLLA